MGELVLAASLVQRTPRHGSSPGARSICEALGAPSVRIAGENGAGDPHRVLLPREPRDCCACASGADGRPHLTSTSAKSSATSTPAARGHRRARIFCNAFNMVHGRGVEPLCLAAVEPKFCVGRIAAFPENSRGRGARSLGFSDDSDDSRTMVLRPEAHPCASFALIARLSDTPASAASMTRFL
jgi:hypothetical protein